MFLLLLLLVTGCCFGQERVVEDQYFNTEYLANYEQVAQDLINTEGFYQVIFPAQDGTELTGLVRIHEDAPYSVICCAGFMPGAKEGLATLIRLLDPKANILFFDARGHGKSAGRFLTNLHNYGLDEYKDIVGALKFMKEKAPESPLFLYGLCAGAYHAAHMLLAIEHDPIIKGLIFDSGFTNPLESIHIPGQYFKEKIAPALCAKLYKEPKKKSKHRFISKFLGFCAASAFDILGLCLYPFCPTKEKLDLLHKIKQKPFEYPVLFIHAEQDSLAKIERVKEFAELIREREEWWIPAPTHEKDPRPEHALNHIKCKTEYLKRLQGFINKQLEKNARAKASGTNKDTNN